ncbi:MAG: hypothetical protein L6V85_09740 [Clostridiales bacterium]|nr:MAG: hypothetical protein L6V85_09740 [Clostridiales bacterium]
MIFNFNCDDYGYRGGNRPFRVRQKNKGEFVDVGIELYSAKQYYVEGETFTPEGGILKSLLLQRKKRRKKNTASSILPTRTLPLKTRRERASIRTPLPQDTKGFRRGSSISCKKRRKRRCER